MRAVFAHPDPELTTRALAALEGAGWNALAAADAAELRRCCARGDIDVVFVASAVCAQDGGILGDLKRDPTTFATAIVLVTDEDHAVGETLDSMSRGAQDILVTPFTNAEVVARAHAAARTRALVDELTERDRRIEELVFVDELTGLYNRRYLLHHLEMAIATARRHDHKLAIVMLDIDRFKPINDTYGHPAGDQVLKRVAECISGRLRTEDVAGRLGGDEFMVVLPDTDGAGAATVAEGIRAEVAAAPLRLDGRLVRTTVSVGWVCWQPDEDVEALTRRVDQALYAAKAGGRNRVSAASA